MHCKRYDLCSVPGMSCSVALFREVKNASEIRAALLAGEFGEAAFVKAKMITSVFQVICAVNKSVLSRSRGKMTTKSVFTEILYNLSPSKNIREALETFGIGDSDKDLLLIVIFENSEEHCDKIDVVKSKIEGSEVVESIDETLKTDFHTIRKKFKLPQNLNEAEVTDYVISKAASKEI